MSVYKDKGSGIWRIQFVMNGRTYIKSSKSVVKAHAERLEAEWKAKIYSQVMLGAKEEITVTEILDQYLASALAKTTKKNATVYFNLIKEKTNTDVNASVYDQKQIERLVDERRRNGVKDSTQRTNLLYLSGAWNRVNKKLYNIPTLELPKTKTGKFKTIFFTADEEEKLFSYLRTRKPFASGAVRPGELLDLFIFLFDTGCRYNEIALLEWHLVDLKNKRIELWRGKTESEAYLSMTNRLHEMLQRRASNKLNDRYIFPNWKNDGPRSLNTTYLNQLIEAAGVNKTVHCIRHTFATNLIKNGFTLAEVQKLLGHKNIQTTLRYAHLESADVSDKAARFFNSRHTDDNRQRLRAV